MWIAKFQGKHKSCIIAPLCKKHNITDFVYLVNAWEDDKLFYYSEAHILQGNEKNKKKFIRELKKQKSIKELEQKGNFIITLEKKPKWMSAYMPLWDKRLIQTHPVIQKTDGTEEWEIAAWEKQPLIEILERLPEEFEIKLKSIKQEKLDDIFLPHIMPKLSEKQKHVIEHAIKRGYFNYPRKTNLGKLAKELKLSKSTTQQHLRAAEKKLIPFLVENIV